MEKGLHPLYQPEALGQSRQPEYNRGLRIQSSFYMARIELSNQQRQLESVYTTLRA